MNIRELNKVELEEVEEYLILDEEDLYSLLPVYLSKYDGIQFSPEGQAESGKEEFKGIRQSLHQKVCLDWNLCNKIDDPALSDNVNLVIAIADIISPVVIGFPPFLIASILVKIGLRKFCNCPSENSTT